MDEVPPVIVFQEERIRLVRREVVIDTISDLITGHVFLVNPHRLLRDHLLQQIRIRSFVGPRHVVTEYELLSHSPLVKVTVQV